MPDLQSENPSFRENQWVKMRMQDDILFFTCKQGIVVDTLAAQGILDDKDIFTEGKPVAAFVDFRGVKFFTISAMTLVSTKKYISQYRALAILLGSYPHVVIGNFFLHIYKQDVPVKMFTDKEIALSWLKKLEK